MAPSKVEADEIATVIDNHVVNGKHVDELHTAVKSLDVSFEKFFGIPPSRVQKHFTLSLAEQSYLPKV